MGLFNTTTSLETYWVGASFAGLTGLASECITDAENEIRKRLAKRYDTSTNDFMTTTGTVPPMVETLCKWLALGYLYDATARGSKESYARADRYLKKAMDNINGIVERKADLLDASGDPITDSTTQNPVLGNTTDYAPTFNEDDPLNWTPDPDKLDDIDSGRD